MLVDLLLIFIIISVLLFIISAIMVEENPSLSVIFIIAGLMFTTYAAFGFIKIDYLLPDGTLYTDSSYGEAYGWGFFFFAMLYALLFVKAGFNYLKQKAEQM